MVQHDLRQEFLSLRKEYIFNRYKAKGLNDAQLEAIMRPDGPVLILAGAGSGKTTVVVNRISSLISFGNAAGSDYLVREPLARDVELLKAAVTDGGDVPEEIRDLMTGRRIMPWNILAITFTNKAAEELKNRISLIVGEAGSAVNASTFHSACVKILRRKAELIGYPNSFTIYDQDDSARLMKEIYKAYGIDEKFFPVNMTLSAIGRLKDELISVQDCRAQAKDSRSQQTARMYSEYQERLRRAGAMDFDDLIYNTVRLFQNNPEVLREYNERYRYIMVDEYQDTSYAQFRLVELLTGPGRNICVVGDDDQSIYKFRGATIENILNFEEYFKGAAVIRLEQNYRSTANILDAANSVIARNIGRKGKNLWTAGAKGSPITVYVAETEQDEARFVVNDILKHREKGEPLREHAVLYRMRAQSNALENYLKRGGIPYSIIGGTRFYDRMEIKDIVAYLEIVANPGDDLRLKRIINKPARKIGAATVDAVEEIASGLGVSMMEVIREAENYPALSRSVNALKGFLRVYDALCASYEENSLSDFVMDTIDITGYRQMLEADGEEGEPRIQNAEELVSNVRLYEEETEDPTLEGFLEEVALVSDIDSYDENEDKVVLMTLHSAKGLEFDYVYIIGMEEGIFPGERSKASLSEIEEERRLAYVGITRARKELILTRSEVHLLFGKTSRNDPSRFLEEVPEELISDVTPKRKSKYLDPDYNRSGFAGYGAAGLRRSPAGPSSYNKGAAFTSKVKLNSAATTRGTPMKQNEAAGDLKPGDRINHKAFGNGVILKVTPMGGDLLLEIEFETKGVKKAMAKFAPITKLD